MAAQKGRDFAILKGDGADPENFTAMGGLRSQSISINNEPVDVTTKDSNGWRDLLPGAGIRTISIGGTAVFISDAIQNAAVSDALSDTHSNYQLVDPGAGTFEGAFMVATIEKSGEHNGESQFSMTFESSGPVTFTAV